MKWHRGGRGYASVLALLAGCNATSAQLAGALGTYRNTVGRCCNWLYHAGLLHIAEWHKADNKLWAAVWSLGTGADAEPPTGARPPRRRKHCAGVEMATFVALWAALAEPITMRAAAEACGHSRQTTAGLLKLMHAAGLLRIAEWDRDTCHLPLPMYVRGAGADAKRPAPQPMREVRARHEQGRRGRRKQLRVLHALAANGERFNQAQRA